MKKGIFLFVFISTTILAANAQKPSLVAFTGNGGLTGFKDRQGNVLVTPRYTLVMGPYNDLTPVSIDSKWGYIDSTGKEVIPLRYDMYGYFRDGIANVAMNGSYGYIDTKGRTVIPFQYSEANGFEEGLALVKKNGLYGFIDKQGNTVVPFQYDDGGWFNEGLAWVKTAGKYGYVNTTGAMQIPATYVSARTFEGGTARVGYDREHTMIIDNTGKIIVPAKYNPADNLKHGVFIAVMGNQYKLINRQLKVLAGPFEYAADFGEGLCWVKVNGKSGFIDSTGTMRIAATHDWGYTTFMNGKAEVKENGRTIFIDHDGNPVLDRKAQEEQNELLLTRGKIQYNINEFTNAFKLFRECAGNASPQCMYFVSVMFEDGVGVTRHADSAQTWLIRSAEGGYMDAQAYLGDAYLYGRIKANDDAAIVNNALKWYRMAAAQGSIRATYCVGYIYYLAHSNDQLYKDAIPWLEQAAANGSDSASYSLALAYMNDKSSTHDMGKSIAALKQAAGKGHVAAQVLLADLYAEGKKLPKNTTEAIYWYQQAAVYRQDAYDKLVLLDPSKKTDMKLNRLLIGIRETLGCDYTRQRIKAFFNNPGFRFENTSDGGLKLTGYDAEILYSFNNAGCCISFIYWPKTASEKKAFNEDLEKKYRKWNGYYRRSSSGGGYYYIRPRSDGKYDVFEEAGKGEGEE